MSDPRFQPHLTDEELGRQLSGYDLAEGRHEHLWACEECQKALTRYEKVHWYPEGGLHPYHSWNEDSLSDEAGIGPFRNWGEDALSEDISGFHPFHNWADDDPFADDDGGIIHVNRD